MGGYGAESLEAGGRGLRKQHMQSVWEQGALGTSLGSYNPD